MNFEAIENFKEVAKEVASILKETSASEIVHSLMNPMTDSFVSYGVTATAITLATLAIDWRMKRSTERKDIPRRKLSKTIKEQEFTLKGRVGQKIGRVKMNKDQTIDAFIADLEALNQINRGRHAGPKVRFEVQRFQRPLFRHSGNFTHYSPFVGSLLFGEKSHEVKGIAKVQRRGKMIYSEVEFESDLGHFRLELPHVPGALLGQELKFRVDIGSHTK